MRLLGNIIWIILGGLITALGWAILGLIFYITIIGIPFGRQCFKFAALSLAPFGKDVSYGGGATSMIANIIWLIFAGLPMAIAYVLAGVANCITIIGIPFGIQSFKLAKLALFPFGAKIFNY